MKIISIIRSFQFFSLLVASMLFLLLSTSSCEKKEDSASKVKGTISGKITDQASGAALVGASVALGTTTTKTNANANGQYSLSGVEVGSAQNITYSLTGYVSKTIAVAIPSGSTTFTTDVLLTKLSSTGTVSGKVTDQTSGIALVGVSVALGTTTIKTNANGQYSLSDVGVGSAQNITYSLTGYVSKTIATTIPSGSTTLTNDVQLAKSGGMTTPTTQTYKLTITFNWNASEHGTLPGGAHFTSLFITTHNSNYTLYASGDKVSAGMESLAETGGTSTVKAEADADANSEKNYVESINGVTSTFEKDIVLSSNFPHLSFATMIAPSPDWFIGVSSLTLYQDNAFVETLSGNIKAYDAGTESGEGFSLSNAETNPKQNVSLLQSMNSIALDNSNHPLATYTIAKK